MAQQVEGNLSGLRPAQIKALERIYQRRLPADQVVTATLARYLTEWSAQLRRQIGILVDRQGVVRHIIVGDDRQILLPDLSHYGLGRSGLRGLRCIHTHLKEESLTEDDLTDLALLRLDMMLILQVGEHGLPGAVEYAHLVPASSSQRAVEQCCTSLGELDLDFQGFVRSLEAELERHLSSRVAVEDPRERAILISVGEGRRQEMEDSLDELADLAATADLVVMDRVLQRRKPHPRSLLGSGKIQELVIHALQQRVSLLVFDQDLTPAQVQALAQMTELKVVDRSQLILDIFAKRAHSLDGKVQVELAQLKYILPRLTGKGSAFSRLAGGIGGRGPGETKLEIDRRRIRDRIRRLEKRLQELARGREQRRQRRQRSGIPIVSIVGYTNAGKSTLLNALTSSEVFTEDRLFATLDTSTRRLRFPRDREVIITDTVGFIRHLPPSLVGAFKATLEELADADLLLHVVDIANSRFAEQIAAVESQLAELDLAQTPRLLVFNKSDLLPEDEVAAICRRYDGIAVSAHDRQTLKPLLEAAAGRLWQWPADH